MCSTHKWGHKLILRPKALCSAPIPLRSALNSFTLVAVKIPFSHMRLAVFPKSTPHCVNPSPHGTRTLLCTMSCCKKVAGLELVGNAIPPLSLNPLPCRILFNLHSIPLLPNHILGYHCSSSDSYGVQVDLNLLRRSVFCKTMLVTQCIAKPCTSTAHHVVCPVQPILRWPLFGFQGTQHHPNVFPLILNWYMSTTKLVHTLLMTLPTQPTQNLQRVGSGPADVSATPCSPPHPEGPQAFWGCYCCYRYGLGGAWGGVEGIEAAARRGACEALGDLAVPTTTDIVSAVVAGLGKSRLNISKEMTEFSWTSLTSLREANASLKEELKLAHAECDAKDRRIVDLEAKLAKANSSTHEWHLKAKELETELQAAKAKEEWARSIVAHSVTRSAPPPQGSESQGSGSHGSQSASPAGGLPPKPA